MADRVVRYVFRGDITDLKAKMSAAGASVGKFADDATRADKEGAKFRQGLTAVGDTAGKVGLAAAAGLGAIVAATANFDAKMSEVRAATGETAANMDKLREAAIQAGADTAFSASEAADGVTELAKAGVSTADILGGGLQGALDLAAAGQIAVGDAAEYSAKAMTQFSLQADQVPHVADLLAAAAGKAVGEVGDFGQALNQTGLVAAQTGLSIEDTVGTLAAFAQAGLQGSDAGTSFKSMLQRLQNPLGQGAKTMSELGISAYDANGQFVGITDVAEQLRTKLSELAPAQRDAALAQMFGSDAVRAASILYKEGAAGIQSWIDQTNDSGFAAEQAAAKLDNLKGDWEAFMGSLETALIGSGEGSQGLFRGLVQGATDAVNAFNDLDPAAKNATTALLGITAVTGGGLWLGAKVVQGVANTRAALDNLGISAGKAGGALKALGYTAAGLTALYAIGQGIKALEDRMLDAVPGVEKLTQSLLNLRDARVAEQFAAEVGNIGTAIDRVTDAGARAQGFDFMHGMGTQMSFLATSAEELASKVSDYESFAEAEQDIKALDAALANIVASGSPELAAQALDNLAAAQGLTAGQMKALLGQLPQYEEALAGVDNAAALAAGATDDMTASTEAGSSALRDHADALREATDAMREKRSEAIRALNAEVNYQASLDDARKSLKENGKTLDITTEKGRANKTALLGVAAAWNDQSAAAKNAPGAHKAAIASFVKLAGPDGMGMPIKKARELARELLELPDKRVKVEADTSQAHNALDSVFTKLASLDGRQARAYVTTVYNEVFNRDARGGPQKYSAAGGHITGPGTATSDSIPAWLSNGEYVIRASAVDHYGTDVFDKLNAMQFAEGGRVGYAKGGPAGNPEDRAEILRLLAEIRDLRKDLGKTGKDALSGLERKRTEAELQATLRDLREKRGEPARERRARLEDRYDAIMSALDGFTVSGALGRDTIRNPTARGVRDEIGELRESIKEAGGEWTKQARTNAQRMVRQAREIDVHQRAIERERKRRDELTATLDEQQRAMEQLRSTMEQFSGQVASNFLTAGPNGSYTVSEEGQVDPALQGRLSAAERRLIELRSSGTGDSVTAAAEASRLLPQIEAMRAEVERQAQPVERTVSSLEAMREELRKNTEDATAFAEALKGLSAAGLDPALFAELAASGDLGLAQELLAGGASAVNEINDLWNERAAAAAEVAAFATQTVYGEQQAILQKQINAQSKLITAADKAIRSLEGEVKVLGDRVERGAERGVKSLEKQMSAIQSAINNLPRAQQETKRAGKGRG